MVRNSLAALAATILVFSWVAFPVFTYGQGTSENVSVEVLREPFVEGDTLTYIWSGDVVQSCAVELRREIIDSDGVVTDLVTRVFDPLPRSELGFTEYEVTVPAPIRLAEGPATYNVKEVPKCSWLQRLFPVAIPYPPVEFTVTR